MRAPYTASVQQSNTGPLGWLERRLRRGGDAETILREAFGEGLSRKVCGAAQRAKLRTIRSTETRLSATGRAVHRPYSARCNLAQLPVHARDAKHVVKIARLALKIAGWMTPKGRTGAERQGHRLNVTTLAQRLGVSERELERYQAVLRSAGVLRAWQPPRSSGCAKGRTGHCFALYELELTPTLERHLARWHGRAWAAARAAATQVAPEHRAPSAAGQAFAAELAARFKPPD